MSRADRFRKGKADVLRVVPDAAAHLGFGGWFVSSEAHGMLSDSFTAAAEAWADAYDTIRSRHLDKAGAA